MYFIVVSRTTNFHFFCVVHFRRRPILRDFSFRRFRPEHFWNDSPCQRQCKSYGQVFIAQLQEQPCDSWPTVEYQAPRRVPQTTSSASDHPSSASDRPSRFFWKRLCRFLTSWWKVIVVFGILPTILPRNEEVLSGWMCGVLEFSRRAHFGWLMRTEFSLGYFKLKHLCILSFLWSCWACR